VRQQRDRAVAGDDQAEPDQPQVSPLLFRLSAPGRGLAKEMNVAKLVMSRISALLEGVMET